MAHIGWKVTKLHDTANMGIVSNAVPSITPLHSACCHRCAFWGVFSPLGAHASLLPISSRHCPWWQAGRPERRNRVAAHSLEHPLLPGGTALLVITPVMRRGGAPERCVMHARTLPGEAEELPDTTGAPPRTRRFRAGHERLERAARLAQTHRQGILFPSSSLLPSLCAHALRARLIGLSVIFPAGNATSFERSRCSASPLLLFRSAC